MDLNKLFNEMIHYGFYIKSSKIDGLQAWRTKSNSLDNDLEIGTWKHTRITKDGSLNTLKQIYDYVYNTLAMKGEESTDRTNPFFEEHHFLLQLARIPKNDKCTIKKILQIAYNIGQFMASVESKAYSPDAIAFYHTNNLNKLESYVELKQQNGGFIEYNLNIYNKYLSMTPSKNQIISFNQNLNNSNSCSQCKNYKNKCTNCGTQFLNILV